MLCVHFAMNILKYKTVPRNFIQQRKNFDFLRRFLNFKRTIVLFAFPCLVAHPMHFQKGSWNGRENVQKWPFLAKPNCQCWFALENGQKLNYYTYLTSNILKPQGILETYCQIKVARVV